MSYTPTTWSTGDVITAEKLNKMESGIESASATFATITFAEGVFSCDKTYSELVSAIESGKIVVFVLSMTDTMTKYIYCNTKSYSEVDEKFGLSGFYTEMSKNPQGVNVTLTSFTVTLSEDNNVNVAVVTAFFDSKS